jgi:CheY-like chemotaxis protein
MLVASKPEARYDLLLTDVVMPGMNGKEVADAISSLLPDIKIAYMSGYTDDAIVSHGVLEEGIHFIRKPFVREDLVNKVLQAIGV